MRLLRGLSRRILVASFACGVVGLVVSQVVLFIRAPEAVRRVFGPAVMYTMTHYEKPRCEADPAHWAILLDGGSRSYAYDAVSGQSQNPDAPPLDRDLFTEMTESRDPTLAMGQRGMLSSGTMILHIAEDGPCAYVQTIWPRYGMRAAVANALLLGVLTIVSAAVALAVLGVMRPLTKRIVELRRAADGIGTAGGTLLVTADQDDELSELGARIVSAHERIVRDGQALRDRERQLERFVADVSHDLRTPLSSLQMALERASDACQDPLVTADITQALEDTVYIAGLTNNLRMASMLREGWDPMHQSPRVDLGVTIERVVSRVRIFARRRGITLESGVPDEAVMVACNPTAAEQAIGNIVDNAVAYGDRGGRIAVVLDTTQDGQFQVTVIDDGPGVPPRELPRLGERAFRTDEARARDPRGSGLGLAITREIAERCGFSLSFAEVLPRGLKVEIRGSMISQAPGSTLGQSRQTARRETGERRGHRSFPPGKVVCPVGELATVLAVATSGGDFMAGINVGGETGGRRGLDAEINMVPMIDLLMCLICFLLITAVWSTMARLSTRTDVPGMADGPKTEELAPMLHVTIDHEDKFLLSWRKGAAVVSSSEVPMTSMKLGAGRDSQTVYPELASAIEREWRASGSHRDPSDTKMDQAVVHCDDRASYGQIVAVIDAIYQTHRRFPGGGQKEFPAMNVTFARAAN